jgi:hypothetical protein
MPCDPVVHRYFGGIYCLHLHDRRVCEESNEWDADNKYSTLIPLGFLLGSLFATEVGGSMFLRNVKRHPADYTASHTRRHYSLMNDYFVQ